MSAIVKACNITNTPKNTGKQCDTAMVATAMLIAVQSGLTFDQDDLDDPVTWLTSLIHAKTAFPLFGQKAPIRGITNNKESDSIVTLDDGLQVFLRYGLYNRMFETTSGGLCYAEALASLLNSGYDIIEIDQQGQMLFRDNKDGTYSPLITDFMYSPSPTLADFKSTPYKNHFAYSFSPIELVNNGVIFKGATALLSMMGLQDAKITDDGSSTTTILKVGVETTCSKANLLPPKFTEAQWEQTDNFRIENVASLGTAIVPSAVNLVGDHLELVGVYPTGDTIRVWGATPAVWLSNGIEGYDASDNYVDIVIP